MIKTSLGAQRYNNRLHKIFDEAKAIEKKHHYQELYNIAVDLSTQALKTWLENNPDEAMDGDQVDNLTNYFNQCLNNLMGNK